MNLRSIRAATLCFLFGCMVLRAGNIDVPPVTIDYFFEAGCSDCNRVRDQVLPELKARFEGFYQINNYDVGAKTNVLRLVSYQQQLKITENKSVCMVVDNRHVLNGFDAIKKNLLCQVEQSINARMDPSRSPPPPILVDCAANTLLDERLNAFTTAMVLSAGLLDGINPCAIATLVFFMSLLVVARVRGLGLLAMGLGFCLGTFLTYTALGFGLLRTLHLVNGFEWARFAVDAFMMALLGAFAFLSFRDAYRYQRSGKAGDLTLQLPGGIKAGIHGIMRSRIGGSGSGGGGSSKLWIMLSLGGFVIGSAVTVLESVCTGQVYVPTLVMVAREGGALSGKAMRYLLLYNGMFLVPLVVVFLLTCCGLRTTTLLAWSKRNVTISKVLLGFFFLAMAVLIAVF